MWYFYIWNFGSLRQDFCTPGLFDIWVCQLLFQLDALYWKTPAGPGKVNSLVPANALFIWTLVTYIKLSGVWASYQQSPLVAVASAGMKNLGETLLPPGV